MTKAKKHIRCTNGVGARQAPEKVVAALLEKRYADCREPLVIAVGGPGGTGKSTFSHALARHLPDSAVLGLDNYRTPRAERSARGIYGSHPDANKMELLGRHLSSIRNSEVFDRPDYDIRRGIADTTVKYRPRRFNILDGEISTYAHFRDRIDFAIFIDADWRTQLAVRIGRDVEGRGASPEKAVRTFLQSNLEDAAVYSSEARRWADIVLYCDEDWRMVFEAVAESLWDVFVSVAGVRAGEQELGGLVVPVLTPFADDGSVDEGAFVRHLDFLAEHGVSRILINGTTGEFFSLTREERRGLCSLARHSFDGAVFFHVGYTGLKDTLEDARWGERHGADALVVVVPYYLARAPVQGLVDYFNEIAQAASVPLVLYNFPKHTQNPLTPECLARIPHFGIKDSSVDLSLIAHTPHYYVGGDAFVAAAHEAGAFGFVSCHANQVPWLHVAMQNALAEGDGKRAAKLQEKLTRGSEMFSGEDQIGMLKYALSLRLSAYPARVRPPLAALDTQRVERIRVAVSESGPGEETS